MTLDQATTIAKCQAETTGRPMAVYRFRGWPPEVYGVRDRDQLPGDAEIAATHGPAVEQAATPAPGMLF